MFALFIYQIFKETVIFSKNFNYILGPNGASSWSH